MFNQKSLAKYSGSAPINYRLIIINLLLIVGCTFVLIQSISQLNLAMSDMDNIARKAAGASPCGMAVPRIKFIMQAVREMSDDSFTDENEGIYVERVQKAVCAASSVTNGLRAAFQTYEIPEDCCNRNLNGENRTDLNKAVNKYLCTCDLEGCNAGSTGYGDIVRRVTHAYALAAPAFVYYVNVNDKDNDVRSRCTRDHDPFAISVCQNLEARTLITGELSEAAVNSLGILAGESEVAAPFPSTGEMLYRLMLLGLIEYNDRTLNEGNCFKNTEREPSAVAFCSAKLDKAINNANSLGKNDILGCVDPAKQRYYAERIGYAESCNWDPNTGSERDRLAIEPVPRVLRRFSLEYADKEPVVAVCSSMLEFGLLDQKRLFGLPDPVAKFEFYGSNHGNDFTRWLAGWAYYGLFDANVKAAISETHVPYLDLKLYAGYRLAATAAWTIAAIASAGYLLAFASVPMAKLLYVRLVRRSLTNTATETVVLKPLGTAEYIALLVGLVVGLWIIFVDTGSFVHFIVDDQCGDYAVHGGPFPTSESRARVGLVGLALVLLCGGTLIYAGCCRRVPRRQRVMPLQPFNLWPIVIVIVGVLIAIIILAIRAGNDWWVVQSTDLNGSDQKSTTDFEEIIWAGFWILLFLGLLMGILNQRHMAANAVLEVPLGRPPLFAYAWAGAGFVFSVIASVFAWPLFDCQIGITTNQFVCGDGVETSVDWNYFWGAHLYNPDSTPSTPPATRPTPTL